VPVQEFGLVDNESFAELNGDFLLLLEYEFVVLHVLLGVDLQVGS
jgi:hypothetical protein